MIPAFSIHCKDPSNLVAVPPLLTTEYWNFLFSLASCLGIDSNHSFIHPLSLLPAYFNVSSE